MLEYLCVFVCVCLYVCVYVLGVFDCMHVGWDVYMSVEVFVYTVCVCMCVQYLDAKHTSLHIYVCMWVA